MAENEAPPIVNPEYQKRKLTDPVIENVTLAVASILFYFNNENSLHTLTLHIFGQRLTFVGIIVSSDINCFGNHNVSICLSKFEGLLVAYSIPNTNLKGYDYEKPVRF